MTAQAVLARFTPERLSSPRFLLTFWFVTRLVVLGVWATTSLGAQNDVFYYFDHIDALGQAGPAATMPEYPTPALWVLSVPWLLGLGTSTGYAIAFACLMLLLDAAFTYSLWRWGGPWRGQAVILWSVFLAFVGPTAYLRFDLMTSVLTGWGLLLAHHKRPALAGVAVGLGAAIKLWPALLWPALCGNWRQTKSNTTAWPVTIAAGVTGGVLAVASLIWGGWERLISPLTYQTDRGLQVESVFASVPMLLRSLHIGDFAVTVSRYQAFEIWGTGVPFWLESASIAAVAGYAAIVATYVIWFWRGHGRPIEGSVLTLLVIVILIVTNKTFSPQYVMWLGGPLAAMAVIMGARTPSDRLTADKVRFRKIAWLVLAMTLATLVVYPVGYAPLVTDVTGWTGALRLPVTLVLVARNAMMVWLLVELSAWTWSFVKPGAWASLRALGAREATA